jgi:hypothetical protein
LKFGADFDGMYEYEYLCITHGVQMLIEVDILAEINNRGA